MQKLVVDVGDGTYAPTLDAANIAYFSQTVKSMGGKMSKMDEMDEMDESIRAILPPRRR